MANLLIELMGDSPDLNRSLESHLSAGGIDARRLDSGTRVVIGSREDCDKVGAALATFIAARVDDFRMRIDGPGGESLIHQVRTVGDRDSLATFLATCAFLQ